MKLDEVQKQEELEQKTCFIGLGSNLGDSHTVLQEAWLAIAGLDGVITEELSSPYCTSPVGMESENSFVNAVGMLHTKISPHELLNSLLQIEADFGRMRGQATGYQDRILDLDLLYYEDMCLEAEQLVLPHPHISERLFVLTPLVEIARDWRDPKTHLTVSEMEKRLQERIKNEESAEQLIDKISWQG